MCHHGAAHHQLVKENNSAQFHSIQTLLFVGVKVVVKQKLDVSVLSLKFYSSSKTPCFFFFYWSFNHTWLDPCRLTRSVCFYLPQEPSQTFKTLYCH